MVAAVLQGEASQPETRRRGDLAVHILQAKRAAQPATGDGELAELKNLICVAQLAGLPVAVTERAKSVLATLEEQSGTERPSPTGRARDMVSSQGEHNARQLSLFSPPPIPAVSSEVERMLKSADLNQMTPMQALNFLHSLSDKIKR